MLFHCIADCMKNDRQAESKRLIGKDCLHPVHPNDRSRGASGDGMHAKVPGHKHHFNPREMSDIHPAPPFHAASPKDLPRAFMSGAKPFHAKPCESLVIRFAIKYYDHEVHRVIETSERSCRGPKRAETKPSMSGGMHMRSTPTLS